MKLGENLNFGNKMNKIINNVLDIGNTISNYQEKFVKSELYDIFNYALDTGIKIALPSVAEDIVIDTKNIIFENGLSEGINQIWNNIKEYAKSSMGIVTGKFENFEQIQMATKSGGALDVISKIIDFSLDKAVDGGKLSKSINKNIKSQKNNIVKEIKDKLSENLENQVVYIEKINKYNEKWQECFDKKDLKGMKSASKNIKNYLDKTFPIEEILKESRKIEIIQNLIESTGSFDITEEEKELAGALAQ